MAKTQKKPVAEERCAKHKKRTKVKAKGLYLQGHSLVEIAKAVTEWTGRATHVSVIHRWSVQEKWEEERERMLTVVNQKIAEATTNDLVARAQEQQQAYREMIQKGMESLRMGMLPEKMSEVVSLIDIGIKGERQVSSGLVSWRYIEEVVKILNEEIVDDEVKRRIANRLKSITAEVLAL